MLSVPCAWRRPYLGHSAVTSALSPYLQLEGRNYASKQSICHDITRRLPGQKHLVRITGLLLCIVVLQILQERIHPMQTLINDESVLRSWVFLFSYFFFFCWDSVPLEGLLGSNILGLTSLKDCQECQKS